MPPHSKGCLFRRSIAGTTVVSIRAAETSMRSDPRDVTPARRAQTATLPSLDQTVPSCVREAPAWERAANGIVAAAALALFVGFKLSQQEPRAACPSDKVAGARPAASSAAVNCKSR